MDDSLFGAISQAHLTLDNTDHALIIDREELNAFFVPLAMRIAGMDASGHRLVVAIGGPPGCGKTAFSTLLVATIRALVRKDTCALIQLDGWHFPNEYLASHSIHRDGSEVLLSRIKGAPETYDTNAFIECLGRVRRGSTERYPVYSRTIHDPVADRGVIDPENRIIIVEGNYLLLDEHPWDHCHEFFDLRLMISAPIAELVQGLRQRHARGGKDSESLERQIREVDLPNIRRVLDHSESADLYIRKRDSIRIASVDARI